MAEPKDVWHFFKPVPGAVSLEEIARKDSTKITVVGVGNVGMACATSVLAKKLCRSLLLIDVMEEKLKGEMIDLQHAAAFNPNVDICASTDYEKTKNSQICIITAGAKQKSPDESRLALVQSNVKLLKAIIPELVKYSPETLLLVVSNPVDILSYVISGLPANRVLGTGTNLDSSRFRFLISSRMDVSAKNVHGEHGDSSVPVWSSVNVAGVPLLKFIEKEGLHAKMEKINEEVVNSAYEIIHKLGHRCFCRRHCPEFDKEREGDSPRFCIVQGNARALFLSLPAVLGMNGVLDIVEQALNPDESSKLKESGVYLECDQGCPVVAFEIQIFRARVLHRKEGKDDASRFEPGGCSCSRAEGCPSQSGSENLCSKAKDCEPSTCASI